MSSLERLPKQILMMLVRLRSRKSRHNTLLYREAALALSSFILAAFLASPGSLHRVILVCYHTSPHRLNVLPGQIYLTSPLIP